MPLPSEKKKEPEWFRNEHWNPEIEAKFFERLNRSRSQKFQYLIIQAYNLLQKHPAIALRLCDQAIAMGDNLQSASAHLYRSYALGSLGRTREELDALRAAVEAERRMPNYIVGAARAYALLVATKPYPKYFDDALKLLSQNPPKSAFPLEHFQWNAAAALISYARGFQEEARRNAAVAVQSAERTRSGYSRHAGLGLVGNDHDALIEKMRLIAEGKSPNSLSAVARRVFRAVRGFRKT